MATCLRTDTQTSKNVLKFNWVTGSPPKFDTLLASWYPTYMQSFIISHSSCAEQYGDMSADRLTHACMHAHTHTHTHTHTHIGWWRPTVTELTTPFAGSAGDQWPVAASFKYTLVQATRFPRGFGWVFFTYKKWVGRTETRTHDRMCFQSIRTV